MTLHSQVIAILLFGIVLLALLVGTNLFIDRPAMLALPPQRRSEAVSLLAIFAAAIGLACTIFGIHFLLFGRRTLPLLYTVSVLGVLFCIRGAFALKRRFLK